MKIRPNKYSSYFVDQETSCALPKQDGECRLTGQNHTFMDIKSGQCKIHIFNGCSDNGHQSVLADPIACTTPSEGIGRECQPCEVHRDSENARVAELPEGLVGYFIPECDNSGHFKKKQRSGSSGYSFCFDKDGNKVESSETPPGQDLDCNDHVDEEGNRIPSLQIIEISGTRASFLFVL